MQCGEQLWKWEVGYEWEYLDGEGPEGKKKKSRRELYERHLDQQVTQVPAHLHTVSKDI